MRIREFESELLKLVSVSSITYSRKPKGKVFELLVIYVHTTPDCCHVEMKPDCMKKQLAYYENLNKKES